MLKIKNLSYKVDNKLILDNINLNFSAGSIVAITGHNGSGKSTLVKIIMGIISQTQGDIVLNGQNINELDITDRAKLGLGYAFQQPVKFKGITVKDLLELAVGKQNLNTSCEYLSKVGLCAKDYLNRELNSSLSGGEHKRIELAINLAQNKKVNIYDEPEAGIDIWSFDNLVNIFKTLKNPNSLTIIVTHQQKILQMADQIVVLNNGKIENFGQANDILPLISNTVCSRLAGGGQNE